MRETRWTAKHITINWANVQQIIDLEIGNTEDEKIKKI